MVAIITVRSEFLLQSSTVIHLPRCERLEPALHRRVLSVGLNKAKQDHHLILLVSGQLQLSDRDDMQTAAAPVLIILPSAKEARVTLEAGSRAYLLGASEDELTAALGDYPEAPAIRGMLLNTALLPDLDLDQKRQFERLFDALVEEIRTQADGALMAISAHLRLILLTAWRLSGALDDTIRAGGDGVPVLQRFRQLVEAQFRRHRPITYYADELGVTADRLHAISTRHLGRPPLDLVHDRLAREARHYLERSSLSVQMISDSLNFKDPAHFSRFFKRRTGHAPAQYRNFIRRASEKNAQDGRFDYYEWP
jgi:AraC family transcriptional regulator, transcriptional activator of pobA